MKVYASLYVSPFVSLLLFLIFLKSIPRPFLVLHYLYTKNEHQYLYERFLYGYNNYKPYVIIQINKNNYYLVALIYENEFCPSRFFLFFVFFLKETRFEILLIRTRLLYGAILNSYTAISLRLCGCAPQRYADPPKDTPKKTKNIKEFQNNSNN